ncbi:AMP-dependent synthetase and ligase [Nostocoides japonicum T1-X7]|uniref:AMP-dependent synthetase and ligase n=1 Tax=Nostocoides japonicum T1-X7 TaxID=1194083 RepID=A0A077M226_9MICO|nr:long-chain fatty acid--CoA ligase [Tetrasphaera japonica]CCH78215.1 AMP-dependent synthetase and ligase [Tetrasphaera japonica T1-X7]
MDHGFGNWPTIQAARNGDRTAYIDGAGGPQSTWREVEERTNRLADALSRQGIRRGDRVAMLMLNSPQMMETYVAVAKLGAIAVPVNTRLHPREVAYVLGDSGSSILLHSTALAETATTAVAVSPTVRLTVSVPGAAERAAGEGGEYADLLASGGPERVVRDVAPSDVCCLMYTSGTTGLPKGAMLTHGNFFANVVNALGVGNGFGREDVTISAAPLFHIGALGVHTLPFAFFGACTVILESFTPDVWLEAVETHRVTKAFLVPAMWAAVARTLASAPRDVSSLDIAITGGAPCPITVIHDLRRYGMGFTEGFGMTETAPNCCCLQEEDVVRKAGSIGRPLSLVDLTILDEEDHEVAVGEVGELCVRGPNVFVGYWDKPAETAKAIRGGWFHTGDMARIDDEGYFTLVDRKKDMVITGGENVYPVEVEQVIYEHPDVTEVAVIGLPDERWGERVVAVVVRSEGSSLGADDLMEWIRDRIARYKSPKQVEFIEVLPRNATGKILKRDLRTMYGGEGGTVTR